MDKPAGYFSGAMNDIRREEGAAGRGSFPGSHPEAVGSRQLYTLDALHLLDRLTMKGFWVGGGFNHTVKKRSA
jgi:hypothetical protein